MKTTFTVEIDLDDDIATPEYIEELRLDIDSMIDGTMPDTYTVSVAPPIPAEMQENLDVPSPSQLDKDPV